MNQERLSTSVGTARVLGYGAIALGVAGGCCCGGISQSLTGLAIGLAAGLVPGIAWIIFAEALHDRKPWGAVALIAMKGLAAAGSGYAAGYCVYVLFQFPGERNRASALVLSLVAMFSIILCIAAVLEIRNLWRVATYLRATASPEADRGFSPIMPTHVLPLNDPAKEDE